MTAEAGMDWLRVGLIAAAQAALTVTIYYLAAGREFTAFQSPWIFFSPTAIALVLQYVVLMSSGIISTQQPAVRIVVVTIGAIIVTAAGLYVGFFIGANNWGT